MCPGSFPRIFMPPRHAALPYLAPTSHIDYGINHGIGYGTHHGHPPHTNTTRVPTRVPADEQVVQELPLGRQDRGVHRRLGRACGVPNVAAVLRRRWRRRQVGMEGAVCLLVASVSAAAQDWTEQRRTSRPAAKGPPRPRSVTGSGTEPTVERGAAAACPYEPALPAVCSGRTSLVTMPCKGCKKEVRAAVKGLPPWCHVRCLPRCRHAGATPCPSQGPKPLLCHDKHTHLQKGQSLRPFRQQHAA